VINLLARFLTFFVVSWAYQVQGSSNQAVQYDIAGLEKDVREVLEPLTDQKLISGYFLSIRRYGEPLLDLSEGFADDESKLRPSPNTLYAVASMTKPLTALAVIKLVSEGRLRLEDPVAKYLNEFSNPLVALGGSYDNQLEAAEGPMLVRQLLTHTSGLTYSSDITGIGDVARAYKELKILTLDSNALSQWGDLSGHLSQLAELPLVAHPGQEFNYSVSYDVLSAVIEKVTEEPFDQFMYREIFEPLGMVNSYFFVPEEQKKNLATLYAPLIRTFQIPGTPKMYQRSNLLPKRLKNFGLELAFASGGTSLVTTADDYQKFLSFLMGSGDPLGLDQESLNLLLEDQTAEEYGYEMMVKSMGGQAINRTMSLGLGIKYDSSPDSGRTYDYHFWGGAYNTAFWFDKETGISGVFMTQLFPTRYTVTDKIDSVIDKYIGN
jgi:CubicO group peptidase (beta-lactamase class C family)